MNLIRINYLRLAEIDANGMLGVKMVGQVPKTTTSATTGLYESAVAHVVNVAKFSDEVMIHLNAVTIHHIPWMPSEHYSIVRIPISVTSVEGAKFIGVTDKVIDCRK